MAVRGSKGPENTDEKFLSSINEMLYLIFFVEFCKCFKYVVCGMDDQFKHIAFIYMFTSFIVIINTDLVFLSKLQW